MNINEFTFKVARNEDMTLEKTHTVYFYCKDFRKDALYAVSIPLEIKHPVLGNFKTDDLTDNELIYFALGSDIAERRKKI